MRADFVLRLAAHLRDLPHTRPDAAVVERSGRWPDPTTFCMTYWHCGTAACVAGWAFELSGQQAARATHLGFARLAGVSPGIARQICVPSPHEIDPGDRVRPWAAGTDALHLSERIRPATAARVLEILAETGEVDWPRALRETGGLVGEQAEETEA